MGNLANWGKQLKKQVIQMI